MYRYFWCSSCLTIKVFCSGIQIFFSKYQIPVTPKELAVVMGAIPSGLCMLLTNCRYSSTVTPSFPNPCDTPVGQICFSASRNKDKEFYLFFYNLFDSLNWTKSMVTTAQILSHK